MLAQFRLRLAELLRERPGIEVARRAIFENDFSRGERLGQFMIVHYRDAVSDALCAQNFDGFANKLWPADFSCVANEPQPLAARKGIRRPKACCWHRKLIATHSERDHAFAL